MLVCLRAGSGCNPALLPCCLLPVTHQHNPEHMGALGKCAHAQYLILAASGVCERLCGKTQEQCRVLRAKGKHAWSLNPWWQQDLVGTQCRNFPRMFPSSREQAQAFGWEGTGGSAGTTGNYQECTPDLLLAHQPLHTSAEPTGIHPGAPPKGPQGHTTRAAPWDPGSRKTPSHTYWPPACQNIGNRLSTWKLVWRSNGKK